MNCKIKSNCPGLNKGIRSLFLFLFCCLPLFGNSRQIHHSYAPAEAWEHVTPYLMPEDHPLKEQLDEMFSKKRILDDQESLFAAGFNRVKPQPKTKTIVTKHPKMKGYVFKIYTDEKLTYYRDEPEYYTWMLRARGAKVVQEEIDRQGWQKWFKAPIKWIYALPPAPAARPGHLQKNFILVEEDMDILPNVESRQKWQDGTITPKILRMIFHIITKTGLRGGCKYDNIPIGRDGRIAFIDTQNNLCFEKPLPYGRLYKVLTGELRDLWSEMVAENKKAWGR
jgi:hypothetical protein